MRLMLRTVLLGVLVLGVGLLLSCQKEDDGNPSGPSDQGSEYGDPPSAPSNPSPSDNTDGVATTTDLSWSCSDPDQDPLTYDVYFGTSMSPPLVSSDQYQESYDPGELETETDYYWQIVAKDDHDNETTGQVWSFTTEVGGGGDIIEQDFELGDTGEMITMVWIPAGTFMMGAQADESGRNSDEIPRHQVILTEGFWMGKYEVTQTQWEAVVGYENFEWPGNPDRPAEMVSHNDITIDFLPELGNEWRLPTEAEWEYACRAGVDDEWFWWGSSYTNLGDYAWYSSNSGLQTHDVGGKLPNPWGLYDMHGNVWEWCADWYDSGYYDDCDPSVTDPQGPGTGSYRVVRGGSWNDLARYCRAANRIDYINRSDRIGFRLVRSGE